VIASLFAAGCVPIDADDTSEVTAEITTPALTPPKPYVLAPDGTTQLSLEQAGIYRANGSRWAVVLGKALFWDEQVGSHRVACASCHFVAGADTRLRNQLSPGFNDITFGPAGDTTFGSERSDTGTVLPGHMPSGATADSNYTLVAADLPLHRLADESNRNAPIISTTNDRISSQGEYSAHFGFVRPFGLPDACGPADASIFHAGMYPARQVEPRNSPTFHNAAFNFRNFWDQRANNLFNGVGPFGLRDVLGDEPDDPRNNNRIVVFEHGHARLTYLQVENDSLASQAMAPPVSAKEMSCDGRTFPDVGRKLLLTFPLLYQHVSSHDSVLGPYAGPLTGLRFPYTYELLIMMTFEPKYWALPGRYRIVHGHLQADPHGYTQMELNFSMFWGLAVAAYESTTISDRSEFDDLQASGRLVMTPSFAPAGPGIGTCTSPTGDVDPLLLRGCTIFARLNPSPFLPTPPDGIRGGNCFVCHNAPAGAPAPGAQPLLSEGAIQDGQAFSLFLTVTDENQVNDLRDSGAATIGLRDVVSDLMTGGNDPYGNPLSFARQYWNYLDGKPGAVLDPPLARLIAAGGAPARVGGPTTPPGTFLKLEADGAAKAPTLRNVALTPPYFSWGGYPSLRQVLKTYNRGMNRRDIAGAGSPDAHGSPCTHGDDSGSGPDGNHAWPFSGDDCNTNTTGLIVPLGLSDCDANGSPNAACTAHGDTVDTDDLAALSRFLKSLTDRRVQCDQAPFDHPELHVIDGQRPTDFNHDGLADDIIVDFPAVGAGGYAPGSGYCIPNEGDLFAPGMQARSGGPRYPLE
jgi:cytochrome c peroxidase